MMEQPIKDDEEEIKFQLSELSRDDPDEGPLEGRLLGSRNLLVGGPTTGIGQWLCHHINPHISWWWILLVLFLIFVVG